MSGDLYFSQFKMPRRGYHWFHLIAETKTKLYYVHTSGKVLVRYANGKEKILTAYIKHNKYYVVKLLNKEVLVKHLVAKEIFPYFNSAIHSVVNVDGDITNCDCYNLRVYTKEELGQMTGGKTNRCRKVAVGNKVYSSVRAAAKELYVSYQTMLDYLNGKNSKVIDKNLKIKFLED